MSTAWKKRNLGPDVDSASIFHPPKRAKQEEEEDVKVKEELTPARQTNLARSLVKHDADVTNANQTPVPAPPRAASVKKEQQQANPTSSTTPTPRTYYEMDTAPESDQEEEDSGDDKTTKFRFMNPKAAAANATRFQSKH